MKNEKKFFTVALIEKNNPNGEYSTKYVSGCPDTKINFSLVKEFTAEIEFSYSKTKAMKFTQLEAVMLQVMINSVLPEDSIDEVVSYGQHEK